MRMENKKITVIVPRLPPATDGLGDYGLALARQLKLNFNLDSEFIVCDPKWKGEAVCDEFMVTCLKKRSADELIKKLFETKIVLLHYVGYGYAKRGCPVWLAKGLKKWKLNSDTKLIITFHECFAHGPFWKSSFWTSALQEKIFSSLVGVSDGCLTSKLEYSENIKKYRKNALLKILVQPVFSNVGELASLDEIKNREKTLVVFGTAHWRKQVYLFDNKNLELTLKKYKIEKVIDIGETIDIKIKLNKNVEFIEKGKLDISEINKIFSKAMIGYFFYPTAYLSKSGIFASYCSHGLLPIGGWEEEQSADGVLEGVHYINSKNLNLYDEDNAGIEKIRSNAFFWYHEHNIINTAKKYKEILI